MATMLDLNQLPVPDWGLRCPHCDTLLAGMPEHCCTHCRQPFSTAVLLARVRPIPDFGLRCPTCAYLITGLMEERCPECGSPFSVLDLLEEQFDPDVDDGPPVAEPNDAHVRKRAPVFTGRERPLPPWGLECAACGRELVGAPADRCPHCGEPFEVERLAGRDEWVEFDRCLPRGMTSPSARIVLYEAQVPYVVVGATRAAAVGVGASASVFNRLLVPREFFFDALHCVATSGTPSIAQRPTEWSCSVCDERVPANFDICWNCGASRPPTA
jgi:rRNA maturation endonuclease Nob1